MSDCKKLTSADLMQYLSVCAEDKRLQVWHLAILAAVICLARRQGQGRRVIANRRRIMALSHVNTIPTHHKYFKQLQDLGYFTYSPSYHPGGKSTIWLCELKKTKILK